MLKKKLNFVHAVFFLIFFKKIQSDVKNKLKAKFEPQNGPPFFAQNFKMIYKRNQDEPKRAITSFKEPTTAFKNLKKHVGF